MYKLSLLETQKAIKFIKDLFQINFVHALNLHRVSAPIIVEKNSGINDNLNGVEMPVDFYNSSASISGEVVQSLAKWKRLALKRYNISLHEGIYTDMNAIRKDEILDDTHSIYVDQWDWEIHINRNERNLLVLKAIVNKIYEVIRFCQNQVNTKYNWSDYPSLPEKITFVSSQSLVDEFPNLTPKERENEIARRYEAVFIIGIGDNLSNGEPHDKRSPDYDDWSLNGDIIVWNHITNSALELSSMGIRVDAKTLEYQLEKTNTIDRKDLFFHSLLLEERLPFSIGGGIGQSRLCYYLLHKQHIGEVQSSIWTEEIKKECKTKGIELL